MFIKKITASRPDSGGEAMNQEDKLLNLMNKVDMIAHAPFLQKEKAALAAMQAAVEVCIDIERRMQILEAKNGE